MKTESVINAMNWTGMALNLIGFFLNTRKSIRGYFMWLISGPLLFCVMWHEGVLPQMILLSVYFALALYGIYNWSKEGRHANRQRNDRFQGIAQDQLP